MEKLNLFGDSGLDQDSAPDLVHYQGELGDFWYNPEEFTVDIFRRGEHLHYCGKGKAVELPKGCINTRYMFCGCKLPDGFTLGDKFDTSNVKCMLDMFCKCELPAGFTLGDKFNTSNVESMSRMFCECELPARFTLGDKFDTSSVKDMKGMFIQCRYNNISFREYFKTDDMKSIIALLKQ